MADNILTQPHYAARLNTGGLPVECQEGTAFNSLPDHLFCAPGDYSFYGKSYKLEEEGIYLLAKFGTAAETRIVYAGDVHRLMCSLAELIVFGKAHNHMNYNQSMQLGRTQSLQFQCGPTSYFVWNVCQYFAIPCRVVHVLTDEPNGFDEGHIMVEVKVNGEWRLYDIASDAMMVDASGNPINAMQLRDTTDWKPEAIADFRWATHADWYNDFQIAAYCRALHRTPEQREEWQRAIFDIVGIADGDWNVQYSIGPEHAHLDSWVRGLQNNWFTMSPEAWEAQFYPGAS